MTFSGAETPSAARIIRELLSHEVSNWLKFDPVARLGTDPEGIHQLRVGSRRLRADLEIGAPTLKKQRKQSLKDELRWIGKLLGQQRDLDVLHDLLASLKINEPLAESGPILSALNSRRRSESQRVHKALNSRRYRELIGTLTDFALHPPLLSLATRDANEVLMPGLQRTFTTLFSAMDAAGPAPTNAQLHAIRICVKQSRYAAEVAAKFLGPLAKKIASDLAHVQDVLGELHDCVVAIAYLQEVQAQFRLGDESWRSHAVVERMIGELNQTLIRLRQEWRRPLERIRVLSSSVMFNAPKVDNA